MKRKKTRIWRASIGLALAVCMAFQCAVLTSAASGDGPVSVKLTETTADTVSVSATTGDMELPTGAEGGLYKDTDMVRVSIVLDRPSTIAAGYSTVNIAGNSGAMRYQAGLASEQRRLSQQISGEILGGNMLDVVWDLTLAANLISANVPYGAIDGIREMPGVAGVYIENVYMPEEAAAGPDTVISGSMTGTQGAWDAGFSGAGSRIAVIDTGVDVDHQSFDAKAFDYALIREGAEAVFNGKFETVNDYLDSLNLLDAEEIGDVFSRLNAVKSYDGMITPEDLCRSSKLAFTYNYVDKSLDVTHELDTRGEHGSHVAGIAAANRYIPDGDGYTLAADAVHVVGQAPEAQLLIMKVFGANGGAYDSDYIAAIEDALLLGCDAINLSLGSTNVGYTYSGVEYYDQVFQALQDSDTVVTISAGNNASWAFGSNTGKELLYKDDVNNGRVGSPSAYKNSLSVASVDNNGYVGPKTTFQAGGQSVIFTVTDAGSVPEGYQPWNTLDVARDGTGSGYDFVFLGDPSRLLDPEYAGGATDPDYLGKPEDYTGFDVTDKVVLVARGDLNFAVKQQNAEANGAVAIVIYNNSEDPVNMDISASTSTIPCAMISLQDARALFAMTTPDGSGQRWGRVTVSSVATENPGPEDAPLVMSSFSSYGVPENLTIKPEITAPGGNIYSVNGLHQPADGDEESGTGGHDQYESMSGTSMAAPQVAGMSAILMQYIKAKGLDEKTGLSARTLAQSLLMGTAEPIIEESTGVEYSVRRQGAGLANVRNAVSASTCVLVGGGEDNDGKVKLEFGDDPSLKGEYSFDLTVINFGEEPQGFTLTTSILAPGIEEDMYMSDSMRALAPVVTWEKPLYDFDGDEDEDREDVQALLDLLSGERQSITNEESADLSGNGEIDAYDAHLLMKYLEEATVAGAEFTVPGGGRTTIHVTVTLSAEDKAYLEGFENGTYVEGYIYLNAVADGLGAVGVSHSVPMLSFYGCWSDASMYERGAYAQDQGSVAHYVSAEADFRTNYMVYRINGSQYPYGLNMYDPDEAYAEERASLSTAAGGSIYGIFYTLIRNSAGGRIRVTDESGEKVYFESFVGRQMSAFYSAANQAWMNTLTGAAVGWDGTDENGEPLPDGARAVITLTTASEFYRNPDGTIRWDEIGEGGVLTMPVLIDNKAPEIQKDTIKYDKDTNVLTVPVTDDHYLAAVVLYNENGTAVLTRKTAEQTGEGQSLELELSLEGVIGKKFKLMAADYAGNCVWYDAEVTNRPVSTGGLYAFSPDSNSWVSFGADVSRNEDVTAVVDRPYRAGTFARGWFFVLNGDNDLYAAREDAPGKAVFLGRLSEEYIDLTYDSGSDNVLYALRNYGDGSSYIYTIDIETGLETFSFKVEEDLRTIAGAGDGSFYAISAEGGLYQVTVSDKTAVSKGSTGKTVEENVSTVFHENTLYWANGEELFTVSTTDGTVTPAGTLSGPVTALSWPEAGGNDIKSEGVEVTDIVISGGDTETLIGSRLELRAAVFPWYAENTSVTWSSSGDGLEVDANGVVTALGSGTVTATSAQAPGVSASAKIDVFTLPEEIGGVTMADGSVGVYRRSFLTGETGTVKAGGIDSAVASTYDTESGALWVMDRRGAIHEVDEATGQVVRSVASGSGVAVYDMEYSQLFGGFWSVYGTFLLIPTPFEENAPLSGFDFQPYMEEYTGGTSFIAVASAGEAYTGGRRCEQVICLDNAGGIWNVLIYRSGASYGAYLGQGSVDIAGKIAGDTLNSALYDPYYGENGGILFSAWDGSNSTLYAIDMGNLENVRELAKIDAESGPLSLYRVAADTDAAGISTADPDAAAAGLGFELALELTEMDVER